MAKTAYKRASGHIQAMARQRVRSLRAQGFNVTDWSARDDQGFPVGHATQEYAIAIDLSDTTLADLQLAILDHTAIESDPSGHGKPNTFRVYLNVPQD